MRVGKSVIASAGLATSDGEAAERAFEAVVTADVKRLYFLAFSILDDAGEAEDAVQETLLKAFALSVAYFLLAVLTSVVAVVYAALEL